MDRKFYIGKRRSLFNLKVEIYALFHFIGEVLRGQMAPRGFIRFLKRLLFFLSKMKENKYSRFGKRTKLNLYVPGFPSKAFYRACKKVAVFDGKMPCVSVLMSVTSACRYNCEHCYQKHDVGKDADINLLLGAIETLKKRGVSFYNIEGGEPFLVFERLLAVCKAIGDDGEIWINSTGDGITLEKLKALKEAGVEGLMFSLHVETPEATNAFMKSDKAYSNLMDGIELTKRAGLSIAANSCLMREDFYNGRFESVMEMAKDLGVLIIQLIKPKPSGGWLGSEIDLFSKEDMEKVKKVVRLYNNDKDYLDYPFIAAQLAEEDSDMFGCTAGGTDRFYINAKGDVQPCEFLNISFGNLAEEDFEAIFDRMRKEFETPGDCWLCEKYSKEIYRVYKEEGLRALPLDPERSKKIYENWDRGACPEFYNKVNKI